MTVPRPGTTERLVDGVERAEIRLWRKGVAHRADDDDPDARRVGMLVDRALHERQELFDEREMTQVIPELRLDATDDLVRARHDAGVRDEDVEALLAGVEDDLGGLVDRLDVGQVELEPDEPLLDLLLSERWTDARS